MAAGASKRTNSVWKCSAQVSKTRCAQSASGGGLRVKAGRGNPRPAGASAGSPNTDRSHGQAAIPAQTAMESGIVLACPDEVGGRGAWLGNDGGPPLIADHGDVHQLEQLKRHVGLSDRVGGALVEHALAERGEPRLLRFRCCSSGCELFFHYFRFRKSSAMKAEIAGASEASRTRALGTCCSLSHADWRGWSHPSTSSSKGMWNNTASTWPEAISL